jgi:hypothetical protein
MKATLGSSPYGNGQAHHVYAYSQHRSELGRRLSDDYGINLNSADNGMWLPQKEYDGLDSAFKGSFHSGRSTSTYDTYVANYLNQSSSRSDAMDRLADIRGWLSNGCMPINAAGVRVKPPRGTCPPQLVDHYRRAGIEIEALP